MQDSAIAIAHRGEDQRSSWDQVADGSLALLGQLNLVTVEHSVSPTATVEDRELRTSGWLR
jgi:hypothetical protein